MTITERTCVRCGYKWTPKTKRYPGKCPKCKKTTWDKQTSWDRATTHSTNKG